LEGYGIKCNLNLVREDLCRKCFLSDIVKGICVIHERKLFTNRKQIHRQDIVSFGGREKRIEKAKREICMQCIKSKTILLWCCLLRSTIMKTLRTMIKENPKKHQFSTNLVELGNIK